MSTSTPDSQPPDSITSYWDDWRVRRRDSGVTVESIVARVGISKTVLYELGKPGKKQFLEDDVLVRTLLELIQLPPEEVAAELARYRRLHAQHEQGQEHGRRVIVSRSGPSWSQAWLMIAGVAVLAAFVGAGVALVATDPAGPAAPSVRPVHYAAVRVQNMVAEGDHDLRPDLVPAYLSTRRIGSCRTHQCMVGGSYVDTGALLIVTCQADGEELVNYNLDSTPPGNPHRTRSNRWYYAQVTTSNAAADTATITGFINEVYIDPHDRGGLGLPACRT